MKKITVVEVNDITLYPPVQTLVRTLLKNRYKVDLIATNAEKLPDFIKNNRCCRIMEIPFIESSSKMANWISRIKRYVMVKNIVAVSMSDSDYLWTTSIDTIRMIGIDALKYKNILQLLELSEYGYRFSQTIKFPLDDWARRSWKTVVPEMNRAYIQKVWWHLDKMPYVLPNKPFSLDPGILGDDVKQAVLKIKSEQRKVILYLGSIVFDRNLEAYARVISKMDGYVLYIAGKYYPSKAKARLDNLISRYSAVYLGFFASPAHLALVQYAHIGLLPYKPESGGAYSELNALYCAPNKIFEYAGYGIPMVGSDVLGLRLPFEKWNMGYCCDDDSYEAIYKAISIVDDRHDEMSANCLKFFDSVNIDEIVRSILED